jgi:HlyD family secretion protein
MKRVVLILTVTSLLCGCGSEKDEKDKLQTSDVEPAPVPVTVDIVQKGTLEETVHSTGQLAAWQDVKLIAKVGGSVLKAPRKEGQHLSAGDIVYKIDPASYSLALDKAQLAVDKARIEYQLEIDHWEGEMTDEVREMIELTTGLKEAELSMEQARQSFKNSVLKAPFDCQVAELSVKEGDIAYTGDHLCRLVNTVDLKVEVSVGENDAVHIREGQNVYVVFPSLALKELRGEVFSVSPVVSVETRGCGVEIRVQDRDDLKPGMYAKVRIVVNRVPDTVVIPQNALLIRDERELVFVVKNGRSSWQYVESGERGEGMIRILDGVAAGDSIIVDGHYALAHDTPVVPLPPETTE